MIEYGFKEEGVYVDNISIKYCQGPDSCQDQDECQYIELSTEDAGGGPFIRMSIPNDGMLREDKKGFWSVSDISDLFEIFDDFMAKVNYPEKNTCYNAPPEWLIKMILEKYKSINIDDLNVASHEIVKRWKNE